ncbi:class I lanthipeptide [Acidobacteriota bacterium]
MKKNNPPKKLRLIKNTIAHLNNEQMFAAHGGDTVSKLFCTDTKTNTIDCSMELCSGDSVNHDTDDCVVSVIYA